MEKERNAWQWLDLANCKRTVNRIGMILLPYEMLKRAIVDGVKDIHLSVSFSSATRERDQDETTRPKVTNCHQERISTTPTCNLPSSAVVSLTINLLSVVCRLYQQATVESSALCP